MELERFIKDLSPELQEKARRCKNVDELIALSREEKVELSGEALAAIAGGKGSDPKNCGENPPCPKCGSNNVKYLGFDDHFSYFILHYKCLDCGHKWTERVGKPEP